MWSPVLDPEGATIAGDTPDGSLAFDDETEPLGEACLHVAWGLGALW